MPSGVLERGVLLPLRFALDQYVNLRPSRLYPGEVSPLRDVTEVDFVVVREGTEGPYVGNGGALRVNTPHEIATEVSVNTRHGVERVVRYAFEVASKRDRKQATLVHKHNVLVHAGHLWRRTVEEVAPEFPDVTWDYLHIDAATIVMTTNPGRFDVIVTDNLFGDILTDQAAAISGGIGLAASGNVNPDKTAPSMFEPVHGSAPDIAGQGIADPSATVLSVALMLDFLGYPEARREGGGCRRSRRRREGRREAFHRRGGRRSRGTDPRLVLPADAGAGTRCRPQHRPPSPRCTPTLPGRTGGLLSDEKWHPCPANTHQKGSDVTDTAAPSTAGAFEVRPNASALSVQARDAALADLAFGVQFTDHMARMQFRDGQWHDRRVEAYGPLQMDPASAVLHYAQEIFEGLKAYRWADGSIHLFRPEANAERFRKSAYRLALPDLAVEDFIGAIEALIETDHAWVPGVEESSLYLRPFMFASEAFLGVRPAAVVDFLVIASPVGAYFLGGVKPVSIWVAQGFHRAGPGGTGDAKCGGNYAASLLPQQQAYANGCQQVLFLDAKDDRYLEEPGRHERLRGAPRRYRRDAPPDRHHPRGHHALFREPVARGRRPQGHREGHHPRRGPHGHRVRRHRRDLRVWHRRGRHPGGSSRLARLRCDGGRRRGRPDHDGHSPTPHGHPVRPRRRRLRLDAQGRLTASPHRMADA
ncbi:hypothetical protein GCM10025876_07440 [Demequina litorisediminis]|uniref:Isopropylmalate dehydrogenase-like domain-containing protein n=1 Tax=Demequina litorisediminis TaxID=1849022 RepID=A0ABQ6I9Q7_9MICO|nr:hypothetical protein GCM10025876_07440 [Demequina litorisediminis]